MRQRLSTEGSQTDRASKSISLILFGRNERITENTTARCLSTFPSNFFNQDSENNSMKNKARKTIAGFRNLSIPALPTEFQASSKSKKHKIICRKPKHPQVAQDDDPEKNQDSLLDIEYLKTEGPKSLSFGLVISKLSGNDDRVLTGKAVPHLVIPTTLGQKQIVRAQSAVNWKQKLENEIENQTKLRAKFQRKKVEPEIETLATQEDDVINLKASKNTFRTYVRGNSMSIRGYSLWNEPPGVKNTSNYDYQRVNVNPGIVQLKAGLFQKKYVDTVDIINKHILINKIRK